MTLPPPRLRAPSPRPLRVSRLSARNTQTLLTAGCRSLTAEAERSALAAASASVASLLALDGLTSVRVCRAGRGYLLVAGFESPQAEAAAAASAAWRSFGGLAAGTARRPHSGKLVWSGGWSAYTHAAPPPSHAGGGWLSLRGRVCCVSSAFCAGCRQLVAGRRLQLLACLRSCVATDARTDALIFVVVACVATASAQVTHRRLGTRRLALATHGLLRR